ncbi:hypothetical protein KKC94_04940 [Patescibacteria group bacterium]|nr:hypothetical protein [Patescibacteria group bacterium]
MKKIIPPLLTTVFFAFFMLPLHVLAIDVAGGGFVSGDECGYITLQSNDLYGYALLGGVLKFDNVTDEYQACADANGYFLGSDNPGDHQGSFAWDSQIGWIDFAWDLGGNRDVIIDRATGNWRGYAWNDVVGWIWFDWTCGSCTQADYDTYRVKTGDSGYISGYAWNDAIGWLPLYGAWEEMPPYNLTPTLTIKTLDGVEAIDVNTLAEAPFADGYQYYSVSLRLLDNDSGQYLDETEFASMDIVLNPTADSYIWSNQVRESGNAVLVSEDNPNVSGCVSAGIKGCVMPEADGDSFNTFIYAGSPTSDMLGLDANSDGTLDGQLSYFTDRDGCLGFYGKEPADCSVWGYGPDEGDNLKAQVFDDRKTDRNKYQIERVVIDYVPANATRQMNFAPLAGWSNLSSGHAEYSPTVQEGTLSFKPRFLSKDFYVEYPQSSGTRQQFIEDPTIADGYSMKLKAQGTLSPPSTEYLNAVTGGSPVNVGYSVFYLVDEYYASPVPDGPLRELKTNNADPVANELQAYGRGDSYSGDASTYNLSDSLPLGYTVYYCGGGVFGGGCGSPAVNLPISAPTAEYWVSDIISMDRFGMPSIYFTGYLPRLTRYLDPEDPLILGAINSTVSLDEQLSQSDTASIIGAASYIDTRNQLYKSIKRLTLGVNPSGGDGRINTNMNPIDTTKIVSLMGGKVLYSTGDVKILGSTNFTEKVLVVEGGDVRIVGNIENTKLGIIVLEKNGQGGNVYIAAGVTDVWANIFADGTVFSYDGTAGGYDGDGNPVWLSSNDRFDILKNQLYIYGTVTARNTYGGADDDTLSAWELGDGTTTTDYMLAEDHDIKHLREFRRCYPYGALGEIDFGGTPEDCNEGELRSAYLDGGGMQVNAPVIIENSPVSLSMPIFNEMPMTAP